MTKDEYEQTVLEPIWQRLTIVMEEWEEYLREYEVQFGYEAYDEYTERHIV